MATIKYTIDVSWSARSHSGSLEVHDDDLEGLSALERAEVITELVDERVSEKISWNWTEVS